MMASSASARLTRRGARPAAIAIRPRPAKAPSSSAPALPGLVRGGAGQAAEPSQDPGVLAEAGDLVQPPERCRESAADRQQDELPGRAAVGGQERPAPRQQAAVSKTVTPMMIREAVRTRARAAAIRSRIAGCPDPPGAAAPGRAAGLRRRSRRPGRGLVTAALLLAAEQQAGDLGQLLSSLADSARQHAASLLHVGRFIWM
jgi:hypothetical protein